MPVDIDAGDGDDTIGGHGGVGAGKTYSVVIRASGMGGSDKITGGKKGDVIDGRGEACEASLEACTGLDDDDLSGGAGGDRVTGDVGADHVAGGGGSDDLFGSEGSDKMSDGKGDDRLEGGQGDDALDGEAGRDRCDGGDGRRFAQVLRVKATTRSSPAGEGDDSLKSCG